MRETVQLTVVGTSVHMYHGTLQITGRYSTSSLTVPEGPEDDEEEQPACFMTALRCAVDCAALVWWWY